jgi:hypothetical protein
MLFLSRSAQDRLIGLIIDMAGLIPQKDGGIALPMYRQDAPCRATIAARAPVVA